MPLADLSPRLRTPVPLPGRRTASLAARARPTPRRPGKAEALRRPAGGCGFGTEDGTERRRNPLKSQDSGAEMARVGSLPAKEGSGARRRRTPPVTRASRGRLPSRARPTPRRPGKAEALRRPAGGRGFGTEDGTERRCNPLKSQDSGAEMARDASLPAKEGSGAEPADAADERGAASLQPRSAMAEESGSRTHPRQARCPTRI